MKPTTERMADMIKNPSEYGFDWGAGTLHKKGMQVTNEQGAPYIVHKDVQLMTRHFGADYFLVMADGTSGRVRDQGIREAIYADKSLASDMPRMKMWILERAFGQRPAASRTVIKTKVYACVECDEEFTNKDDLIAHSVDARHLPTVTGTV